MKTAMQTLISQIETEISKEGNGTMAIGFDFGLKKAKQLAEELLEMEEEQMAYSKEDVLKAGEMGEINYLDTKHIVSYLDEAKQYNKTFKQQEQ